MLLHAVVDEFARERDINTITIILPARIGLEDALDLLHPLDLGGGLSALLLLPIAGERERERHKEGVSDLHKMEVYVVGIR